MKLKKTLSFLFVMILLLTFSSCRKNTQELSHNFSEPTNMGEETATKDYITLLYSFADTFNPYTLSTDVNRQLCKLLYEPLVKLSNEFSPVYSLAKTVVTKGKKCTVTLKTARFSDGSYVTGEDVEYSYNLAKKSKTSYGKKLYEVSSLSVTEDKVVFELKQNDPYFENVLDFPIIKKESDKEKDSDSVALPPIGCGRYKLDKNRENLVLNDYYYGKKGSVKKIKLINAPDAESVAHYAEIGAADIYFSEISDGNIMRMSGKKESINLNNMVYIGINQNYSPLNEPSLRQAISSALNRVKICETAFYNNALAATGYFHPLWEETKSVQNIQIETNSEITIENLKEIGYNRLDSSGIRMNLNGISLKFTLLVNSENRIRVLVANTIAKQLKDLGIGVTVVEKKYKQYKAALKKGNFQLYLGEVKFTDNMDLSSIIMQDGTAAYGLPKKAVKKDEKEETSSVNESLGEVSSSENKDKKSVKTLSQEIIEEYRKGKATIKDVASVLQTEMPVVPVCYRTGVLFYNDNIENVNNSSLSDIYFSIDSYVIN